MRTLIAAATALLLTGLSTGTAVAGGNALAGTAEEPSCLSPPFAGNGLGEHLREIPVLTTSGVYLQVSMGTFPPQARCPGITVQLQKTNGTNKLTVALDGFDDSGMIPHGVQYGFVLIPRYDGAGTWEFTRISRGSETLELDNRFKIIRGSYTSLDQPTPVASPRHTVVTGRVWDYTPAGGLTPSIGRTVRIRPDWQSTLATTRSDSSGQFRVAVPIWGRTSFNAHAEAIPWYAMSYSNGITASVWLGIQQVRAPATVRLGGWWTLTGQAFPRTLATSLDYWNGEAWVWTGSRGDTVTGGWFKRGWKPTRTGTFRLRLAVAANPAIGLLGNPAYRSYTVKVVR